jgi:phage baseplate assembly protein W
VTLGWVPPPPPNGVVFTPSADTNAQAAAFYGEDVWFDVTQGAIADYVVTAAGDWQAVSGITALRQSLLRRTITNPGEWKTKPGYGVGAREYVKAKDTPAMRAEITARVRQQYLLDQRVESVDSVTIEKVHDGIGPGLRLNVAYTPRGRLRTDKPDRIVIEVR